MEFCLSYAGLINWPLNKLEEIINPEEIDYAKITIYISILGDEYHFLLVVLI